MQPLARQPVAIGNILIKDCVDSERGYYAKESWAAIDALADEEWAGFTLFHEDVFQ